MTTLALFNQERTYEHERITVIVTGGRHYEHQGRVWSQLDDVRGRSRHMTLIVGDCPYGADKLARDWFAKRRDVRGEIAGTSDLAIHIYKANWSLHGTAAGPIRNKAMVDAGADLVLAFSGGRGTASTIRLARAAGIPVIEVM